MWCCPPLAPADLATLHQVAKERHFRPTLVMTDTVVAGCCIVALAFYPVHSRDEVLPPLYANGAIDGAPQTRVTPQDMPWDGALGHVGSLNRHQTLIAQEANEAL